VSLHLLDSCVVIDVLRGREQALGFVRGLLRGGAVLATCDVVEAEVAAGMRPGERTATLAFLDSLQHLALSRESAVRAGAWKAEFSTQGTTLSLLDCLIAAAAVEHAAILVTENATHYPQPELRVLRPSSVPSKA
jgi:predicted nucleic acid-binding protein